MADNRYFRGLIQPLIPAPHAYVRHPRKRGKVSNDIRVIARFFILVGHVFVLSPGHQTASRARSTMLLRVLELAVSAILVASVVKDILDVILFLFMIPFGLTLTTFVQDTCSLAIRAVLWHKRGSMVATMRLLDGPLSIRRQKKKKRRSSHLLLAGFSICFAIPAMSVPEMWLSCASSSDRVVEGVVQEVSFGLVSASKRANCAILTLMELAFSWQIFVMPGFTIVLCCYVFGQLKRRMESFLDALRSETDLKVVFKLYMRHTSKIAQISQEVRNAFSVLLLTLYIYMFCSVFNVTTFMIRMEVSRAETQQVFMEAALATIVTIAFCSISIRAVAINDTAVKITNSVHKAVARSDYCQDFRQSNLLLIAASEFPSKAVISAWSLFDLKRSFIQRTASVMITYGIILSQMK